MTKHDARVGIILAGGSGTRLLPLTRHISKQLLPLYDKPVIFYPLTSMILMGIREIFIIVKPGESQLFRALLGHGEEFGLTISYLEQAKPNGIADALLVAKHVISGRKTCLILGDNFFYGSGVGRNLIHSVPESGATVLAVRSLQPSQYGVISFDKGGRVTTIEEKPKDPQSNWIVPGMYFYDEQVLELVEKMRPSDRGELEITDLNNLYLLKNQLNTVKLPRGTAWFDLGTVESLHSAAEFVRAVQSSQGILIGSPHEAAQTMDKGRPNIFRETPD